MPRNRTSAQKQRDRRRLKSIKMQQRSGSTNVDTSRFDRWGLPQGATPPSEDSPSSKLTVSSKWVTKIIEYFGSRETKAFGYTKNNFPMFSIMQEEDGVWSLSPYLCSIPASGGRRVLFMSSRQRADSKTFDEYPYSKKPRLALFGTKKEALEMLNAEGSIGEETRLGKFYVVTNGLLRNNFSKDFKITSEQRHYFNERIRDGIWVNVHVDNPQGTTVIPGYMR